MGLIHFSIKNQNVFRLIWLNGILVIIAIILNFYYFSSIAEGKHSNAGKKKVVIVGEMSDLFANESSRSEPEFYQEDYDYTEDPNHNRIRRGNHHRMRPTVVRRKNSGSGPGPGSMFVPVAAYSITKSKSKSKPYRSSNGYRKRQGGPIRRNPDLGGKQTESAVYGYMQRPEIIEFRGQYFYGPNRGGDPLDASGSNIAHVNHPSYEGGHELSAAPANSYPSYLNGNSIKSTGGLGPGGLLLATLPLILAPMLSYLFTPMVIPITATVAAGRRKRDTFDDSLKVMTSSNIESANQKVLNDASFGTKSTSHTHTYTTNEWANSDRLNDPKYKEAQVVVEYLRKVHFDEKATTKAIANFLQCDGMLADEDHCIERLSCEFSDPNNYEAPELDRAVTSIILGHILANEYITDSFKLKLKIAAVHGKENQGKCDKFQCLKVQMAPN